MQAARELTSPQPPDDGPGPAAEARRFCPCCPRAACCTPRSPAAAGRLYVAAHSLGGRRRAQARARWAEATSSIPRVASDLADVEAEAGAEELERLAQLESRTGGAGGPGPQPAPLVAAEVAAHSKAAGSLAEWLLGARELSRAALEAEAAHAWEWPQRLLRRSTGGQAGTAGSSTDASAAAPALGSAVRDAFRASRKLAAYQQRVTHLTVRFVFHFKHIDALIAAAAPRAPRLPPLPAGASAAAVLAAVESWVQQVRQVFDLEELVSVSCLSEIEREWATAWKPVMMKLDRLGRLLY
ncbi:hypothetical protein HYH03_014410 [Edaphochlamys debaryana]|uniref:Uncharacterized protein n=1 Tax=Edaphochlamys debaryana TaxID=47281 RepID=A0A836BRY5_9CHLO|nr:hypothetical protein HYH03_014410 [Edaphochlamys debaryana]|eukprot:KAG2486911.1 hypothetical protein HYH03_014410 [Edaphochlamys debaryana]